jgi:hypothetical protein
VDERSQHGGAPTGPTSQGGLGIWMYAWWIVVGILLGLGTAGLLTIGLILLPLGVSLALVGILVPVLRNRSAVFLLAGLGLSVLYVAWLNRGGPGAVCEGSGSEISCTEEWSPWPFVVIGVLLVVVPILLARALERRDWSGRVTARPQ